MPAPWGTALIFSGCYVKICDPSLFDGTLKQQQVRRSAAAKTKVNLQNVSSIFCRFFPAVSGKTFISLTENTTQLSVWSFLICDFRSKTVKYNHLSFKVTTKNLLLTLRDTSVYCQDLCLIVHWQQRVHLFGSGWKESGGWMVIRWRI